MAVVSPILRFKTPSNLLEYVQNERKLGKIQKLYMIFALLSRGCPLCLWYEPCYVKLSNLWAAIPPVARLGTEAESVIQVRFVIASPEEDWKEFIPSENYIPRTFLLEWDVKKDKPDYIQKLSNSEVTQINKLRHISKSPRDAVAQFGVQEILIAVRSRLTKMKLPSRLPVSWEELSAFVSTPPNPGFPTLCQALASLEKVQATKKSVQMFLMFEENEKGRKEGKEKNLPKLLESWREKHKSSVAEKLTQQIVFVDLWTEKPLTVSPKSEVVLASDFLSFLEDSRSSSSPEAFYHAHDFLLSGIRSNREGGT